MTRIWRYTKRLLIVALVCVVGLLSPIAYVETMCRGTAVAEPYEALLAPEHHRPESRTLMTYPEWHIVHAYEDYAHVIAEGDPHDFGYLRAIGGFWSSLCALTTASSAHGEIDGPTKQMVYVIGTSFSVELLLKAAYEESLGRLFATLRGEARAPLDDLSAEQAASYATFLQQVPWYKWPFRADSEQLKNNATDVLRDRERRVALGIEYGVKAAYAEVIAQAVAQVGQDELTLRMIVRDIDRTRLQSFEDVTLIGELEDGFEIETPRYRVLTHLLQKLSAEGANFVEIAGNDDILFTAVSGNAIMDSALFSRQRQGTDDHRHLVLIKVSHLASQLRNMSETGQRLEHIHDY